MTEYLMKGEYSLILDKKILFRVNFLFVLLIFIKFFLFSLLYLITRCFVKYFVQHKIAYLVVIFCNTILIVTFRNTFANINISEILANATATSKLTFVDHTFSTIILYTESPTIPFTLLHISAYKRRGWHSLFNLWSHDVIQLPCWIISQKFIYEIVDFNFFLYIFFNYIQLI